MKTTYVILYRKGISGPVLGWFGQFNDEGEALDEFPFPPNCIEVLKIYEAEGKYDLQGIASVIAEVETETLSETHDKASFEALLEADRQEHLAQKAREEAELAAYNAKFGPDPEAQYDEDDIELPPGSRLAADFAAWCKQDDERKAKTETRDIRAKHYHSETM